MTKTALYVANEVTELLTQLGLKNTRCYVNEVRKKSKSFLHKSEATGMFQIEIPEFYQRGSRRHLLRTTKEGVIPTQKISEIAAQMKRMRAARQEYEMKVAANNDIAVDVRDYMSKTLNMYVSDYITPYTHVAPSAEEGKVSINIGSQRLTVDQAKQLIDLIASFK